MNPTNPLGGYGQPDPLQALIALLQGFAFQSGLGADASTSNPYGTGASGVGAPGGIGSSGTPGYSVPTGGGAPGTGGGLPH